MLKAVAASSETSDALGWLEDRSEEVGKRKVGRFDVDVVCRVGNGGEGDVMVPVDTYPIRWAVGCWVAMLGIALDLEASCVTGLVFPSLLCGLGEDWGWLVALCALFD